MNFRKLWRKGRRRPSLLYMFAQEGQPSAPIAGKKLRVCNREYMNILPRSLGGRITARREERARAGRAVRPKKIAALKPIWLPSHYKDMALPGCQEQVLAPELARSETESAGKTRTTRYGRNPVKAAGTAKATLRRKNGPLSVLADPRQRKVDSESRRLNRPAHGTDPHHPGQHGYIKRNLAKSSMLCRPTSHRLPWGKSQGKSDTCRRPALVVKPSQTSSDSQYARESMAACNPSSGNAPHQGSGPEQRRFARPPVRLHFLCQPRRFTRNQQVRRNTSRRRLPLTRLVARPICGTVGLWHVRGEFAERESRAAFIR